MSSSERDSSKRLVVGLGNPGKKYELTRHNVGFWWVERLAASNRASFRTDAKFRARVGRLSTSPETWLLLPDTYMNHSGQAVAAFASFYKIAPEEILVVHDELDLAPGSVKLKLGGGTSGHNGLADIIAQLATNDFWRLRIGIGHPRESAAALQPVVDYVLHPPRPSELTLIEAAIEQSLSVWPLLAASDYQGAMLKLHTKEKRNQ